MKPAQLTDIELTAEVQRLRKLSSESNSQYAKHLRELKRRKRNELSANRQLAESLRQKTR